MTNKFQPIKNVMLQLFDQQMQLRTSKTTGRTSQQILAEIQAQLGFIPPFFDPAEATPQILDNLWQQTLSAYLNNPIPALFKEKLSAYLARFCAVPYCMVCHSCTLRPLGLKAHEVLELLEAPPPIEPDIAHHLKRLASQPDPQEIWSNPDLEASLLACAIFIALEQEPAEHCRKELRRLLGPTTYQYLVTFIAYVKTCSEWMEAHPEVVYEADLRVQKNLGALLEEEPELANFFHNYREKVEGERQRRMHQLVELVERQQWKETIQQQLERERLITQISQRIRQSLDLSEVLSTTVSEVRQFLQADRVLIYRFEPDWSGIVAVESVAPGWDSIQGTKIRDSFFVNATGRQLYQQGQLHVVEDVQVAGLSQCHLDALTKLQIRANLVVPIVQGDQLWGLLVANQCDSPRRWESLELNLLKHLATQLAIAIQQSELYEQVQTELSERQRSEAKIREQAALLDITTDAIFVLDLDSRILLWNKGAEQLYGRSTDEALSMPANSLLSQKNSTKLAEIQKTVIRTSRWQGQLHQVSKDGKEILVESRWTLMPGEVGQPISMLVVNTDITQRALLEKQFFHAQRLESLGTLASGIAHDLNNILTPILISSQLLQMKLASAGEPIQRLLKMQESNAQRGAALLKQVLSFARGAAGQCTTVQVSRLLLEINQVAKETFPKAIEVHTDVQPHLWTVFADANQLHQVFMNLCVNARDAMPSGGTLHISANNLLISEDYRHLHPDVQVGPYIVVTVRDTGTGIPPELLDKVFEPFFTTKAVGKGTGLGLAAVSGIIKNHGGFVEVQSQIKQGTEFRVYIPAVQTTETQISDNPDLPWGSGELILLVDDEAAIREITKTSLETYGYQVITARDGLEAVAFYAQHQNDVSVVLMDMMMPEMDGPTAIRVLKKINPLVKIITVSGLVASDLNAAGEPTQDIAASLSKPYPTQALLTTLRAVITSAG